MSASNAAVWGRVAVYSTLEELRRRMLCLRTSDWSVARWNRHGLPFGGRVVLIRRQRTLAGHLCTLVNDRRVSCGRAGTAYFLCNEIICRSTPLVAENLKTKYKVQIIQIQTYVMCHVTHDTKPLQIAAYKLSRGAKKCQKQSVSVRLSRPLKSYILISVTYSIPCSPSSTR